MIKVVSRLPTAHEFSLLRAETSWGVPSEEIVTAALSASIGGCVAMDDDDIIGMVRVVGDGVLNAYIQDVIVRKSHRGQGIGNRLMTSIIAALKDNGAPDSMIGLFAADGQSAFYKQYGFNARPDVGFGPGMHATLSDLRVPDLAKSNITA